MPTAGRNLVYHVCNYRSIDSGGHMVSVAGLPLMHFHLTSVDYDQLMCAMPIVPSVVACAFVFCDGETVSIRPMVQVRPPYRGYDIAPTHCVLQGPFVKWRNG